ncbi:MAG TPA: SH3 domain-containing protein [Roseiflexaceae bacterium]|jgi:hypothetical protein|nr:SH3 domain-containing protein [Roseiflexaceae bacterium]
MDEHNERTEEQKDNAPADAAQSRAQPQRSNGQRAERPVERVARAERERQAAASARETTNLPDITQVGQIIRERFSHITRQFPREVPRRPAEPAAPRTPVSNVTRDRIAVLIAALGDPAHAMHQQAVQELVTIGDAAVPALNEALNPRRSWLTNYRAAEALGQIGDGRATGPLIEALRNSNSNVRWGAVRALAAIGDARALFELRRVAHEDQGKTSWGEPVAGAAQSAIEQMRSQNVLLRGAELVQTAIACVLMLVALILAWSVVTSLRTELRTIGHETITPITRSQALAQANTNGTAAPAAGADATAAPETPEPTAAPTATAQPQLTGKVRSTANVRASPSISDGERVGIVNAGDDVIFVATTPDRSWYKVKLGQQTANGSRIDSTDGTGWVSSSLLSAPSGSVPVEQTSP